ncbi:MAG: SH3 domain-containing protein [Firmicutes bacterium]|nr:SH3 domain-containing protein [Bacillota bacterium]
MYIKAILIGLIFCIFLVPAAVYAADCEYETEKTEEVQRIFVTTANLNLRPTPSTDQPRITLVSAGRNVLVTDLRDGEWFAVDYNGIQGYMYAEFLREVIIDTAIAAASTGIPGRVELLEWSVASSIIPQNTPLTVIDVRTGLRFQMKSFSHGSHADLFPVTTEDTDIIRRVFGGSWTWTPRPVVLLVGDRSFVASMSGMPHGGGINRNNGMNGHLCMHFLNSRTHNGNRSHEQDHQNAVREAYNTASDWEIACGEDD